MYEHGTRSQIGHRSGTDREYLDDADEHLAAELLVVTLHAGALQDLGGVIYLSDRKKERKKKKGGKDPLEALRWPL